MYMCGQHTDDMDNVCVCVDNVQKLKLWIIGYTRTGLSLRIFRHSYCGQVVQKSHSSTPKFTRPHLERTKYAKASEVKP